MEKMFNSTRIFFFKNQAKLYQDAIFHILEWQIPKTMIISTIGSTKEDCNSSSRKLNNNNYFPLQARNHLTFNHVSQWLDALGSFVPGTWRWKQEFCLDTI